MEERTLGVKLLRHWKVRLKNYIEEATFGRESSRIEDLGNSSWLRINRADEYDCWQTRYSDQRCRRIHLDFWGDDQRNSRNIGQLSLGRYIHHQSQAKVEPAGAYSLHLRSGNAARF